MDRQSSFRLKDFWAARGQQSFWPTVYLGYAAASVVALACAKLRLTPNMVTGLSVAVTTVAAAVPLLLGGVTPAVGALVLVGLWFGYVLDCADGTLARVTGGGSPFGAILDKVGDAVSGILMLSLLAAAAPAAGWLGAPSGAFVVLGAALAVRTGLAVCLWLKEEHLHGTDRLRIDRRPQGLAWRISRGVGCLLDEVVFRVTAVISLATGWFWEWMAAYHLFVAGVLVLYIYRAKGEIMAAAGQGPAGTDRFLP